MNPRIETLPEKKLIGKRLKMSFSDNRTGELWQSFMPRLKEIRSVKSPELHSIEIYDDTSFFESFNPRKEFEKWAAIEVTDFETVPSELKTIILPSGLYAVFPYQGTLAAASKFYQYIFGAWLPDSEFSIDNRPHFAVMGEKYKNDDPNFEEEVWIPIKPKKTTAD